MLSIDSGTAPCKNLWRRVLHLFLFNWISSYISNTRESTIYKIHLRHVDHKMLLVKEANNGI